MALSTADMRVKLGVTPVPAAGQGIATDPRGVIPATLLPRYLSYTPTWTASGTAPAIGNATVTARYTQLGKMVHAYGKITFGSTSTFGTGNYSFALPVTASTNAGISPYGAGQLYDNSANVTLAPALITPSSVTTFMVEFGGTYLGTDTVAGQLAPWTWAVNDILSWNIFYEAAA